MKKLVEFICKQLVKFCEYRGKVFYIKGGDENKTVYLVRYILFKSKYGCIYIHRFMRSDSDTPHDHPWNFFTYVIAGGYSEVFYQKKAQVENGAFASLWTKTVNSRVPGSVAYRKATDVHQVVVDQDRNMDQIEQAPFTICLMGPRLREWGFWSDNGTTWTDWRKYLNISPKDPRIEGAE